MPEKATIHISQTKGDPDLKSMMKKLIESDFPGNPYFDHSENYVAKKLLALALEIELAKYCKKSKKGS